MDESPEPGTAQPHEWLPPDSMRIPLPESSARHSSPVDALPEYSQPLAYSQPSPYGPPPSFHGEQPVYNRPTPYGQSPYGRPSVHSHHDYPFGGPGLPPFVPNHPPARRRSRVKTVAAVAGGLVACLLVLAVVLGVLQRAGSDNFGLAGGHQLTLPDQSAGYVRINTPVALDLGKTLADQVKTAGPMWTKPIVGIYGSGATGSPSMVFIGGDAASNPQIRKQLGSTSLNVAADEFLAGAHVAQSTTFPAGKFGGLLKCGQINGTEATCVWVDHSTFGSLVLMHPPELSEAADIALVFRNATEH